MQRRWNQLPPSPICWLMSPFVLHGILAISEFARGARGPGLYILSAVAFGIAVAAWFEQRWARWVGGFLALAVVFNPLRLLLLYSFTMARIGFLIIWSYALWGAVKWTHARLADETSDDPVPPGAPLISMVMLLKQPKYLDEQIVKSLAEKAWGVELNEENDGFVAGESPMLIISYDRSWFLVHNWDTPYVEDPVEAAESIPELRLKKAMQDHRAWIAIDLLCGNSKDGSDPAPSAEVKQEAYRRIALLIAALADQDCTALFFPESSKAFVYDAELDEKLRGPTPLDDLNVFVPVVAIDGDDPRIIAATEEAQRRWPEFVAAFASKTADDHFGVKAPVSDGVNTEFMWLEVVELKGDRVVGTLGNEPVNVEGVKLGDSLQVASADVQDWLYISGSEPVGGFSIRVLAEAMKGKQSSS